MASDASRRWLDQSGIWSCRIKIPQSQGDTSRASEESNVNPLEMSAAEAMDRPLDTTSPRRKAGIAEAMHSMVTISSSLDTLDLPTDPDAQATVTDFLDFTEYLPSDMIRSLTLIGNLDQTYCKASADVNELTKLYGQLPNLPADRKPDPVKLRADISRNLNEAVSARTLSHAEACRMADNVDRHYNRAKSILAKLQAMAEGYPASPEPSPAPLKSKSPAATRGPKIMLRLDGARTAEQHGGPRVRKHRAPRITVPGDVLAPYELDYESYGSETDSWDSAYDEPLTPRQTPRRSLGGSRIKLKIPRPPKARVPKPPRGPRPPGVMGTNVHSAVAGISTSNALAKLKPPPENAQPGSEHAPWLQLTAWELAKLRKRMKKNAVWSPSDTMIARELKQLGRGIEAYRAAKSKADATGQPFDQPVPPQVAGQTVMAEGAISVDALGSEEIQLSNRGMKLNEAKKLKKENQAKELAKQAAEEAEESARKMAEAAKAMKGLFSKPPSKDETRASTRTPTKTPARKRKRESTVEIEIEKTESGEATIPVKPGDATMPVKPGDATMPVKPQLKRSKTETPVPAPHSLPPVQGSPAPALESASSVASSVTEESSPTETLPGALAVPVQAPSPNKSSTPILPPTKEPRKDTRKEVKRTEIPASTRPQRTSAAPTPTPIPEVLPLKRPTSSRGKAASAEPISQTSTALTDRPRRASTARNTPAPEPRQSSKRAKRPAPGVLTAGTEGSTAVSVGKRSAATRKKAGTKKEKKDGREGSTVQEIMDEVDDEGNIIDPDEPRYCLCNRVSFGTMIGCENPDCEKEWFHLECVGLSDIPARTTKWYCPDCRVKLRIGEKGEVNARGKKK